MIRMEIKKMYKILNSFLVVIVVSFLVFIGWVIYGDYKVNKRWEELQESNRAPIVWELTPTPSGRSQYWDWKRGDPDKTTEIIVDSIYRYDHIKKERFYED